MKNKTIVISVESLNPRFFNFFGYEKKTSPYLNALQAESLNFFNCFANAGFTPITMKAIHTGNFQINNHQDKWQKKINEETLASVFKKHGYKTAGFVGFGHVGNVLGFNQGFDLFDEPLPGESEERNNKYEWVRAMHDCYKNSDGDLIGFYMGNWFVDRFLNYIKDNKDDNLFIYCHYTETHIGAERAIPQSYCNKFKDTTPYNAYYDAKINWMDEEFIKPLINLLKDLNIYEETNIFFVGDHGESMNKHGEQTHGLWCFAEGIRVPLIIKSNKIKQNLGSIIKSPVRSLDIFNTSLYLADIPLENKDSKNLISIMGKNEIQEKLLCYSENYGTVYSGEQRSIILDEYHFLKKYPVYPLKNTIKNPHYNQLRIDSKVNDIEFYNIIDDPYENTDLTKRENYKNLIDKYENILNNFLEERTS